MFDELDALTRGSPSTRPRPRSTRWWRGIAASRRRAAALALPRPVLPGAAGHLRPISSRSTLGRHRPRRAASSTPASDCRSTTCCRAATSSRSRANARTPSAMTWTARATSACWPTSCPTRNGWRRCCTSCGHAAYSSKNIPRSVPYVLRCESHTLTTEGVAMMFERFADNAGWLMAMGVKVPDPEQFRRAARGCGGTGC